MMRLAVRGLALAEVVQFHRFLHVVRYVSLAAEQFRDGLPEVRADCVVRFPFVRAPLYVADEVPVCGGLDGALDPVFADAVVDRKARPAADGRRKVRELLERRVVYVDSHDYLLDLELLSFCLHAKRLKVTRRSRRFHIRAYLAMNSAVRMYMIQ